MITIGSERFRCPEALFQPSLLGKCADCKGGVHTQIFKSIMKCDPEIQAALFYNVALSGGGTMFDGVTERMQKELSALAPSTMEIRIIAPPERKFATWIGGSLLASLEAEKEFWVTNEQYADIGPEVIGRIC